jgi:hypothetical protein
VDVIKRLRMKPLGLGGWAWWLSISWIGMDAASSGVVFISSTQPVTVSGDVGPAWLNTPWLVDVIATGEWLTLAVWLLLAFPVLYAGIGQLAARRLGLRVAAWSAVWVAGVALTFLIIYWQDNLPEKWTCSAGSGCGVAPYYGPAVVNMRELAICIAFLALGAVMTWILAGPNAVTHPWRDAAT